ncbi:hypothetical protein CI610_03335 [invertebrate metagenome]|uniref:SCP2 domain-containing protein n=1 Tax=invertebrate metagenome TaxID=1711999 RepID=A0A2H9T3H1_9ZZZZ
MGSIADTVQTMKEKFNADAAEGLDLTFQFVIEDDDNYVLTVKNGTCEIIPGDHEDPNVTLLMNAETMTGIMTGEIDGMQAFMMGNLRAEGDMLLATKLGELFSI